jgi:hypothetical protein
VRLSSEMVLNSSCSRGRGLRAGDDSEVQLMQVRILGKRV